MVSEDVYTILEVDKKTHKITVKGNLCKLYDVGIPQDVCDLKVLSEHFSIDIDKVLKFIEADDGSYDEVGVPVLDNVILNMISMKYKKIMSFIEIMVASNIINTPKDKMGVWDPLTGVLNRTSTEEYVDKCAVDGKKHALLMIDIDGFRNINDTFGHICADKMLVDVVNSIKTVSGEQNVVGRVGGDEFIVFVKNYKETDEIVSLARRISSVIQRTFSDGVTLSVSIGITLCPTDGTNFKTLFEKADLTMYYVKNSGGNSIGFYNDKMVREQVHLGNGLNLSDDYLAERFSAVVKYYYTDDNYVIDTRLNAVFDLKEGDNLYNVVKNSNIMSDESLTRVTEILQEVIDDKRRGASFIEVSVCTTGGIWKWFQIGFIKEFESECVYITITDINDTIVKKAKLENKLSYDELTGLVALNSFYRRVEESIIYNRSAFENGKYAMLYFDILKFKMINDIFGMNEGDNLLIFVARKLNELTQSEVYITRISGDRFAVYINARGEELEKYVTNFINEIAGYFPTYQVVCNVGIYITDGTVDAVTNMLDRAIIAQGTIKGSVADKFAYYKEGLRSEILGEQEITGSMIASLENKEFKVYYQAQFNHLTGTVIGAEALVRWIHPVKGLLSPALFIPVFEKNGFITELDKYVFEQVCVLQKELLDSGMPIVPISVNLARCDLYKSDFVDELDQIRCRYGVPVECIRIEITESIFADNNQYIVNVIDKFHKYGYLVEMDDFGKGYSSLNVLKDIEIDILKLDMAFISNCKSNERAGIILSSIVRMAKWLDLPIVAEGVEEVEEADYLVSIGCFYIQGYLYSKPVASNDFVEILNDHDYEPMTSQVEVLDTLNSNRFWDPASLETLIFSNYVGAAAVFEYCNNKVEILRVNDKYAKELGIDSKEMETINYQKIFDDKNNKIFVSKIKEAIKTGDEVSYDTWRTYKTKDDFLNICVHADVRMIGRSGNSYIFYTTIHNITREKRALQEIAHREELFREASEQVNIYYWEYFYDSKEMYPCYRCKRDLGFDNTVNNYPETAFEMGVIPEDYKELYCELLDKLRNGAKKVEAVILLTSQRLPFLVKYTNVFDDNGKPYKAYGSAHPMIDSSKIRNYKYIEIER